MEQYKTIRITNKKVDELLNDLNAFGWTLISKQFVKEESNDEIIGTFDEDEDKLAELMLSFDFNAPNATELYKLSEEYLIEKDRLLKASDISVKGQVTGIVFASIAFTLGFLFLFIEDVPTAVSIIFFVCSIPAYPLCISFLYKKNIEAKETREDSDEELKNIKKELQQYENKPSNGQ